uniref:Uncharacterized protein n=1 Tax=Ditylenchus dipsaci TaxID=166011 RepID=A0A915CWS2_9BILA
MVVSSNRVNSPGSAKLMESAISLLRLIIRSQMDKLNVSSISSSETSTSFRRREGSSSQLKHSSLELFLGRRLRTPLSLLRPSLPDYSSSPSVVPRPSSAPFVAGQDVYARSYSQGAPKWVAATIQGRIGSVLYSVRMNGHLHQRHVSQIRRREIPASSASSQPLDQGLILEEPETQLLVRAVSVSPPPPIQYRMSLLLATKVNTPFPDCLVFVSRKSCSFIHAAPLRSPAKAKTFPGVGSEEERLRIRRIWFFALKRKGDVIFPRKHIICLNENNVFCIAIRI